MSRCDDVICYLGVALFGLDFIGVSWVFLSFGGLGMIIGYD